VAVFRLHFAFDRDLEVGDRPAQGQRVGEVAEWVLTGLQRSIAIEIDTPSFDVLSVVIARRQAQQLHDRLGGAAIGVMGAMSNGDAHECA
jgi:hypothetical protein